MPVAPYPLLQQQQIDEPPLPEGFYSRPESWRDKVASFLGGDDRFRFQKMQEMLGGGPQGSAVNPLGAPFNLQEAMVNKDAIGAAGSIPGPGMIEGMLAKGGAAALGKIGASALGKAMLVGPSGKLADKLALSKAEDMLKKGAPIDDIWQAQHWAPVGATTSPMQQKWATEVWDPPNNFTPPPVGGARWADVMDNPEFFKNYPDLADMRVSQLQGKPEGYRGVYFKNDPSIQINPKNPINVQRGSIFHEGTHAVEHREGWPSGTSSQHLTVYPTGPGWQLFKNKILEMQRNPMDFEEFSKTMLDPSMPPGAAKFAYKSYQKNLTDAHKLDWNNQIVQYAEQLANYDAYLANEGEALAREPQRRADWLPDVRAKIPLGSPKSADITRENQIPGNAMPWPGVINPFPKP